LIAVTAPNSNSASAMIPNAFRLMSAD
jgi:hypothetical protein